MSTTTPNLGLTKPDIGSTDWGTAVNGNWDIIDGASSGGGSVGQCRLEYVSTTSIKLIRYNGKNVLINGALQPVPSAGVTLSNGGLSASTLYYIYVYMSSGTMTLIASTSTPTAHSTYGNQVSSGDNAQSLVGMIRTNGSSQFVDSDAQRFIRSWFNEGQIMGTKYDHNYSTSSGSYVELTSNLRVEFIAWSGESVVGLLMGGMLNNTQGAETLSRIYLDGSTTPSGQTRAMAPFSGYTDNTGLGEVFSGLSAGYHYLTLFGMVTSGTGSWYSINVSVVMSWRQ